MGSAIKPNVKAVLENTSDVYSQLSGSMNADYAAFASMSLAEFKEALEHPELTGKELRKVLRLGHGKHQDVAHKASWSSFMADYVQHNTNNNKRDGRLR